MSTILKLARLEFKGGPMENHWGFVGQSMGAIIDAIDLGGGMGRYEKVGKGVEECAISEDGERVFYEMVHIDSPTNAKEMTPPLTGGVATGEKIMKSDTTTTTEKIVGVAHPRLVRPLEVGCVVTTNGGKKHTIAEIGFGGSEGVAENCFYHWDKDWPYEIEHAAMDPDRDTIVSVYWPNVIAQTPPDSGTKDHE